MQKENYDKALLLINATIVLNALFCTFNTLIIENRFEYDYKLSDSTKTIFLDASSSNNSICSDLNQSLTTRAYEFANYCPKNKCINNNYVYFVKFEKKENTSSISIVFEYDIAHKSIIYNNDAWQLLKLDESNLKIIKIQDVLQLKCFKYDLDHNLLFDNNIIFKNIKGKLIASSDSESLKYQKRLKKTKKESSLNNTIAKNK